MGVDVLLLKIGAILTGLVCVLVAASVRLQAMKWIDKPATNSWTYDYCYWSGLMVLRNEMLTCSRRNRKRPCKAVVTFLTGFINSCKQRAVSSQSSLSSAIIGGISSIWFGWDLPQSFAKLV